MEPPDHGDATRDSPGAATRLAGSARGMLATLLGLGRTRLELLTVELQLEARRGFAVLVWASVAVLAGGMALLMAGLTVVLAFWDSHRLLAAILVTVAFIATGLVAAIVVGRKLTARPRLLEGTLAELSRDVEQLRGPRT